MKGPTDEAYQDSLQTFKATREICQRLETGATKNPDDSNTSLPLHDLVQFCEIAVQQCNAYIDSQRPFSQSALVHEKVRRGLGALGFDPNTKSDKQAMLMLDLVLSECKRRTEEVLSLLDKKLDILSSDDNPIRNRRRPATQRPSDYQRLSKKLKAMLDNDILKSESPYMEDKRRRIEKEAEIHLFPKMSALWNDLLKVSEGRYRNAPSTDDSYPEKARVEELIENFLCLSNDWTEYLQTITDPLNVRLYQRSSDVPYRREDGAAVGSGSFGLVFKAENTKTHTIVAIKQLSRNHTSKSQSAVGKELTMLQICKHPNIVKLLDAYQIEDDPSTFYLVMEPWAPYTLSMFLHQSDSQRCRDASWFVQGSHRTERQVYRIFHGLGDGLSYLHERSIKHKDLKPENILLYDAGPRGIRPIIADLGISKIFRDGSPTDYNKSTYAYLAPEQVNMTGSSLRSDVWQLGCCFALILAVSCQGSVGCQDLWSSFENSDVDCSCNIALEAPTFMKTLNMLCGHGSVSQLGAHRLITAMLATDPDLRLDIETVRKHLADL